jgi:hypothetical protein
MMGATATHTSSRLSEERLLTLAAYTQPYEG